MNFKTHCRHQKMFDFIIFLCWPSSKCQKSVNRCGNFKRFEQIWMVCSGNTLVVLRVFVFWMLTSSLCAGRNETTKKQPNIKTKKRKWNKNSTETVPLTVESVGFNCNSSKTSVCMWNDSLCGRLQSTIDVWCQFQIIIQTQKLFYLCR